MVGVHQADDHTNVCSLSFAERTGFRCDGRDRFGVYGNDIPQRGTAASIRIIGGSVPGCINAPYLVSTIQNGALGRLHGPMGSILYG